MKKLVLSITTAFLALFVFAGCSDKEEENTTDYSGTYTGYSWKDEVKGVTLDEAQQKIESIMTLDKDGIITDFDLNFLVLSDDIWVNRDDVAIEATVDFSVTPVAATPGKDAYAAGTSMFDISTADMMDVAVFATDADGNIAIALVCPSTRYIFEAKLDSSYLDTPMKDLKIGTELIPTIRTSSGGMIKPESWDELNGKSFFEISDFQYVVNKRGPLEGTSEDSTVAEMLEAAGAKADAESTVSLFYGAGGWAGNYEAIAKSLIGQDAKNLNGITDFSGQTYYTKKSYEDSINEDNFFGVNTDTVSTATKSIQQSYDTISGATVRISRENTAIMRSLVEAGFIKEEDVIKGRF